VTFSIVARAPRADLFGVAIASSSPAVAARCAHARAGIGAVASQNITDPAPGARVLDCLASGANARTALDRVLAATEFAAYRQLLVVGREGAPQVHSGARALGTVGSAVGEHAVAAGNLLASSDVPRAMIGRFEDTPGHLGARLLAALAAGLAQGGEAGPVHSAGLLVVRDQSWPIVDLRVDWTEADPVAALRALWDLYAPQIEDYVQRAVNPSAAPRFGVPGDP
jgi:uncharacterized Ntn-hydrolase superfamily protein